MVFMLAMIIQTISLVLIKVLSWLIAEKQVLIHMDQGKMMRLIEEEEL